jgi:hypothetical protein
MFPRGGRRGVVPGIGDWAGETARWKTKNNFKIEDRQANTNMEIFPVTWKETKIMTGTGNRKPKLKPVGECVKGMRCGRKLGILTASSPSGSGIPFTSLDAP